MKKAILTILVVDDSKYQRFLISDQLAALGECVQARHGNKAVQIVERMLHQGKTPDLVIMDILMPEMNGHAALRQIMDLQEKHGIPPERRSKAIMFSSLGDPQNILQAQYEDGAHYYLTKPLDPEALQEALRLLNIVPNPVGGPDVGLDDEDVCIPV